MGPAGEDDRPGVKVDLAAFQRDGALHVPAVFDAEQLAVLTHLAVEGPGSRLRDAGLPAVIAPATNLAAQLLFAPAQPVRAVLFDKTPTANWLVAWHQDRTITVTHRETVDGFGPWSLKDRMLHVAPPIDILERMVTLRIHIDAVGPDNAPLKAALRTHRIGFVASAAAAARAAEHTIIECLAEEGDVWAYSTPILHASERAVTPSRRRVLQVDYAACNLPSGLHWAGIG